MSAKNNTDKRLIAARILVLAAFAALMLYGAADLPYRGDPEGAINREESITQTPVAGSYYVREAYSDAHTPNMVTVILGDYRSIDTLGEQVVVFTAGLICLLLLKTFTSRNRGDENGGNIGDGDDGDGNNGGRDAPNGGSGAGGDAGISSSDSGNENDRSDSGRGVGGDFNKSDKSGPKEPKEDE